LQEASSVVIELLNYFHDYIIFLLIIIIVFVSYLFIFVIFCLKLDKNITDSHVLESI